MDSATGVGATRDEQEDDALRAELWDARWKILLRIRLSIMYHRKREWFYDIWDKVAKAVAVIGASSAIALLVGPSDGYLAAWIQGLIVVTSTVAMVFDFANQARRHSDFAVRFAQLERDLRSTDESLFTSFDLHRWTSAYYEIQTNETAPLRGLVLLCQHEMAVADGQPFETSLFTIRRRIAAHFGFEAQPKLSKTARAADLDVS